MLCLYLSLFIVYDVRVWQICCLIFAIFGVLIMFVPMVIIAINSAGLYREKKKETQMAEYKEVFENAGKPLFYMINDMITGIFIINMLVQCT